MEIIGYALVRINGYSVSNLEELRGKKSIDHIKTDHSNNTL